MSFRKLAPFICLVAFALLAQLFPAAAADAPQPHLQRLLYVAAPGIRDDLQFGGHGVLIFNIDRGHKFVRRIAFEGLSAKGVPLNVKGIAANARTARLYVTTIEHLIAIDLASDRVLWQKSYDGGCDRLALAPDGKTIYLPSLEKGHWHVVDALDGRVLAKLTPNSGAHNTIYGPDGTRVYLAGLKSPVLNVAETEHHAIQETVGPFSNVIRPFAINGSQTLCFVNVNDRLGFEVGDLRTGKVLHAVDVQDFKKGPVKMHGCPCHGIGLTPDGRELWLCDAFNRRLHIFDATQEPPRQVGGIRLRDEPGWITFGIDGTLAYPSTGEVIDTKSRKIIATLQDENGRAVHSEKLLEIDWEGTRVLRAGNQFGISRQ
jgi:hypothetical protein